MNNSKDLLNKILAGADIVLGGSRPWDIVVRNEKFYNRVMAHGSLGFGESYMDGWWECDRLDELVARAFQSHINTKLSPIGIAELVAKSFVVNLQRKSRAFQIGERHYDIGNDLYELMLDHRMTYTCGYWQDTQTLDQAQEAKLDLVCRKIGLDRAAGASDASRAPHKAPHILDIGCGWGSFMLFAAQKYGVRATGLTVSKEQIALGEKRATSFPITFKLMDYRDATGTFDHVVSLGMFEHVGSKNYRVFMETAARTLADDGLFLLHTIGGNTSRAGMDPWVNKYIFPNSQIPSIAQISAAAEGLFVIEDWHNFGAYYDNTLMEWFHNFDRGWPQIQQKYGERFYRMWKFYLLACAGMFRARELQLWQIVMSKHGVPGGYVSVR